ncbi:type III pantothenate kinase [Bacillus shivajii]|uniref:type III pantothenate kinase n=1 Tax=Bacillus shivajii TaxID=1983719 RepID=UPI001CFBF191|nr:type III pantothenate kinase [Bacillus shivajii]UCZ53328.1 type III pantothenate kinase [Bacillus shivajii]
MVLVMDVGNTNIALGVYEKEELKYHWRIGTDATKSEDEYTMLLKNLFEHEGLRFSDIDGVMISSVVPPIMYTLESMCKKYFRISPKVIGPGIKTGLNIKYDNPKEVGADRIVNAVAAIQLYGPPLIIVDFGTATTYCYIDDKGQYIGGAIAPGIRISSEALYNRASKLPRIEIAQGKDIIGKNTVDAMQAGLLYGYVGQVEGIVERMKQKAYKSPTVIATGGLAKLISSETEMIDIVDPLLTVKGLKVIYDKNNRK